MPALAEMLFGSPSDLADDAAYPPGACWSCDAALGDPKCKICCAACEATAGARHVVGCEVLSPRSVIAPGRGGGHAEAPPNGQRAGVGMRNSVIAFDTRNTFVREIASLVTPSPPQAASLNRAAVVLDLPHALAMDIYTRSDNPVNFAMIGEDGVQHPVQGYKMQIGLRMGLMAVRRWGRIVDFTLPVNVDDGEGIIIVLKTVATESFYNQVEQHMRVKRGAAEEHPTAPPVKARAVTGAGPTNGA